MASASSVAPKVSGSEFCDPREVGLVLRAACNQNVSESSIFHIAQAVSRRQVLCQAQTGTKPAQAATSEAEYIEVNR